MSQKFEKLKTLLMELFQLNEPELDFGIYRILHAKSGEVTKFLGTELLPQVRTAFAKYQPADKAALKKQLDEAVAQAQTLGADPETLPRVKDLRAKLADGIDLDALEGEVFDHLHDFFRRYYHEGDFLSRRVYKPGVYAVPYEGQEVYLHWANKDQYYIKSSEQLRDYAFRLRPHDARNPMRVHFCIVDATEGEHGNVKAAEGKDRVFVLAAEDFARIEDDELSLRFEYRPARMEDWPEAERAKKTKPPSPKDLLALTVSRVLESGQRDLAPWIDELKKPAPTESQPQRTTLAKHVDKYTKAHKFDYFIHKDLGKFLRRELDFYIKNEVMHLDDIESETAPKVEQYLSKIRVLRAIAGKLIDFLAQLEDFQKKLWLKKKFVVESSWLISVGVIPEEFYPEIAANEAQREEWVKLFAIDEVKKDLSTCGYSAPLTAEFVAAHPSLVLDTLLHGASFTNKLLQALGSLEDSTDAVLIKGENYHALQLLNARYAHGVECTYIDPPYNTGNDGFAYKDSYQHSSWLSALSNRLEITRGLMSRASAIFVSIDDGEQAVLRTLMETVFGPENFVANIIWQKKYAPQNDAKWISDDHDFLIAFAKGKDEWRPAKLPRTEEQDDAYQNPDKDPRGRWRPDNYASNKSADERPNGWYGIANPNTGKVLWPNRNAVWRYPEHVHEAHVLDNRVWWGVKGDNDVPAYKRFLSEVGGMVPRTIWKYQDVGHTQDGLRELRAILPQTEFTSPKAVGVIERVARISGGRHVLDFFGGSGTTGQAVFNLNRQDGVRRRLLLAEVGDHFETVLLPRLKRVAFTPEWKDGKPARLPSQQEAKRGPRVIKVLRLESYEDALNNLETQRTPDQQQVLFSPDADGPDGFREDYTLRYMLDVETRDSPSLLNVRAFLDPTAYKLKVKRPGSDESREVAVDLLETFNWLLGLVVREINAPQSFSAEFQRSKHDRLELKGALKVDPAGPWWFRTVTGTLRSGERVLVIWRKRPGGEKAEGIERDNLVLDEWLRKVAYSTRDLEFDLIYVNGDNNLPNVKRGEENWKVRLIDEEFHRLMFEGTESGA